MKRKYLLLLNFLLLSLFGTSTTFTSVTNGAWGVPATWGGVYVSSFFTVPVAGTNYFTAGAGDTIIVNHAITMDYNIFVRDPDVLIIGPSGSITHGGTAVTNSFYHLSSGTGYTIAGISAGLFVEGEVNVEFFRNAAVISVQSGGAITTTSGASSGDFENFGDTYNSGSITIAGPMSAFNNNSGDLWMYASSLIDVQDGDFNNRTLIREFPTSACITASNNFNNLLGGTVMGNGGGIGAGVNVDNSANPLSNFDDAQWCAGSSGINLPLALENCPACSPALAEQTLIISADWKENAAQITWLNSSDNGASYALERAVENGVMETIYSTETTGHGYYTFTDHSATLRTTNYYRLLEYNLDGQIITEQTISLEPNKKDATQIRCYPNPAVDVAKLEIRSDKKGLFTLEIWAPVGHSVYSKDLHISGEMTMLQLNDVNWSAGMYLVRLLDEKGVQIATNRIIVR